jgi:DNA-binding MarR family transcriptional regulator
MKDAAPRATRANLGFLLAKALQRWNELLYLRFCAEGYPEVTPSYGSILLPLFEEDALRMGELARRARLSKQTMTTLIRAMEAKGLVRREVDPQDRRASRICLTERALAFREVAEAVLEDLDRACRSALGPREATRLRRLLRRLMDLAPSEGKGEAR